MKHLIFTVLSLLSLQQYAQQLLTESEIDEKKFGNESIHFLKSNNTRLNGAYKIGNNELLKLQYQHIPLDLDVLLPLQVLQYVPYPPSDKLQLHQQFP